MSISEFIQWVELHPTAIIMYMVIVPAIAFILSMFYDTSGNQSPAKYLFSALIYATCVPGIVAIILSGYDFFYQKTDFKDANILVYFLPIISMIVTIVLINRVVNMSQIPGFKRLSGLMMMIAVTSILVFILNKMIFVTVFFGSVYALLGLFIVLFVIIKIGWDKVFN